MRRYDVAIVGSGFAGSILARALNRRGRRVLLLERGKHPRFALGESTTPLANFALERLAQRYDLPDLRHLSAHGRWLEHLPHLRRGLKRGFTFYRHRRGEAYRCSPRNETRLLVAASPDDEIADTHWLRQDVDHHLAQRAQQEGVELCEETELVAADFAGDAVSLEAVCRGERRRFAAAVVVDGSGPAGFLAGSLPIASLTHRIAVSSGLLYAHFSGLRPFAPDAGLGRGPYPDERAAVHHLLDEGWMYVLPFDHGTASAGIVLRHDADRPPDEVIRRDPGGAWTDLLARYPSLAEQFAAAVAESPIRFVDRMQYRLERAASRRWFLLPHAYAFYDPMFSTGMAWSLLAVERLADLLGGGHGDATLYGERLRREADQIERLIECAYLAAGDFERFAAVAFLYFAVVSFAEASQRLLAPAPGALPPAWSPFLGAGDSKLEALFEEARRRLRLAAADPTAAGDRGFRRFILERIAPFDVVGLGDPGRLNLYPVDLEALIDRAPLLGLSREALKAALPRLRGQPAAAEST